MSSQAKRFEFPDGQPDPALLIDRSGRPRAEYRPLKPVIVKGSEIEAEIQRLCEGPFRGSRRTTIVHPALTGSMQPVPGGVGVDQCPGAR